MTELFQSISLLGSSIIFLTFIAILYVSKKREKTFNGTCFRFMIITSYLINIVGIIAIFLYHFLNDYPNVYNTFGKLFCVCIFAWFISTESYLLTKFIFKDSDKNASVKNIISIIMATLFVILSGVSLFLDLNYTNESGLYVITGSYMYFAYALAGVCVLSVLYILYAKRKELATLHKFALYGVFFIYFIALLLQTLMSSDISDIPYVLSMITFSFYFMIESDDLKQLEKIKKENEEQIKYNQNTSSYIDDLFDDIINPLNNIYTLCEIMKKKNNMSLEEYTDNMKSMCNEARLISYASSSISKANAKKGGKKR